jgi:hypothetical protein
MGFWSRKKSKLSAEEVAQILENFLDGTGDDWEWDGFTRGMELESQELNEIRKKCVTLCFDFPPDNPRHYCNEQGLDVIREHIRQLRASSGPRTKPSQ